MSAAVQTLCTLTNLKTFWTSNFPSLQQAVVRSEKGFIENVGLETELPNSHGDNIANQRKCMLSQGTSPEDRITCLRIPFGTCLKADSQPLPLEILIIQWFWSGVWESTRSFPGDSGSRADLGSTDPNTFPSRWTGSCQDSPDLPHQQYLQVEKWILQLINATNI